MTVTHEPLPSGYEWGYVTGKIVHGVADTPADPDRDPEARPAVGKVIFTPSEKIRKASGSPKAIVLHERVEVTLDSEGKITDSSGGVGIALITGLWDVAFTITGGTIQPFKILVTKDHTTTNPLDLTDAAPYIPPGGFAVTTLVVPAGGGNVGDVPVVQPGSKIGWVPLTEIQHPPLTHLYETVIPTTGWANGQITVPVPGLSEPAAITPTTQADAMTWSNGRWWAEVAPGGGAVIVKGTPQIESNPVAVTVLWWEV